FLRSMWPSTRPSIVRSSSPLSSPLMTILLPTPAGASFRGGSFPPARSNSPLDTPGWSGEGMELDPLVERGVSSRCFHIGWPPLCPLFGIHERCSPRGKRRLDQAGWADHSSAARSRQWAVSPVPRPRTRASCGDTTPAAPEAHRCCDPREIGYLRRYPCPLRLRGGSRRDARGRRRVVC